VGRCDTICGSWSGLWSVDAALHIATNSSFSVLKNMAEQVIRSACTALPLIGEVGHDIRSQTLELGASLVVGMLWCQSSSMRDVPGAAVALLLLLLLLLAVVLVVAVVLLLLLLLWWWWRLRRLLLCLRRHSYRC
jgi:hypothetical protein